MSKIIMIGCMLCAQVFGVLADEPETIVVKKKGYTLTFVKQDTTFDKALQQRLTDVFFTVYPKLAKNFNKNAVKEVTVTIDTAYDGVAYAHNGKVTIAKAWLEKNPGDVDVITHEVMHIVQAYPPRSGPGWLVEGIADYVRYAYGVDNAGAGWSLPELKADHHYENSYRITARFLDWVERAHKKGIVKKLDKALRSRTYADDIWNHETGSTLDELWIEYSNGNA